MVRDLIVLADTTMVFTAVLPSDVVHVLESVLCAGAGVGARVLLHEGEGAFAEGAGLLRRLEESGLLGGCVGIFV